MGHLFVEMGGTDCVNNNKHVYCKQCSDFGQWEGLRKLS